MPSKNSRSIASLLSSMKDELGKPQKERRSQRYLDVKRDEERSRQLKRYESSGISKRFLECSFENFKDVNQKQKNNKVYCMKYVQAVLSKSSMNLVLSGFVGNGKTHLAVAIMKELIAHGLTVRYTTLFDALRGLKDFKSSDYSKARDLLRSPNLLVIDEINSSLVNLSETDKNLIFEIFNNRYKDKKPTLIITNLDAGNLEDALGYQVLSRLYEDSRNILTFTSDDYRIGQK